MEIRILRALAPCAVILLGLLLAPARSVQAQRPSSSRTCGTQPGDSARVVQRVLDSLARGAPFRSKVYRYQLDSLGIRIVTMPADARFVDGMAIVRIDPRCRIVSIVQTDSA